jgi:predicted phage-related endonuclease
MNMITHTLIQGTPEWKAYRAEHDNASDAPAVMGYSSYTSRNDLLKQRATGIKPEVDSSVQRIFDNGHLFEAFARPLAEAIIGEDLFPVTGSLGKYSASFDGLTLAEDIDFEHKTLNEKLRSVLVPGCTGADLPMEYQIQMEQQCLVSGCDKVLFMASKWVPANHPTPHYLLSDEGVPYNFHELIEERHCWYTPNGFLRKQIVDAWAQFALDLAAYQHVEAPLPVVATHTESLPAVSVRLNGQLAVATNLPEFDVALRAFIKNIPANPSTDQEFADCEAACKSLKKAEDALAAAEENAMAQVTDVEAMRRLVGELRTLSRTVRLEKEKAVTARKEAIRIEIITAAKNKYASHIADLNKRNGVSYLGVQYPDFATAIKGKRTISSLQDAVDTLLANAKIEANATADRILQNISVPMAKEFNFLFSDLAVLCLKEADDFLAQVSLRVGDHQAKEVARIEAETARIAEQERIKAEAKAAADFAARSAEQAREFAALEVAEMRRLAKLNSSMVVEAVHVAEFVEAQPVVPFVTNELLVINRADESTGKNVRTYQRASTRSLVDNILDTLSEADMQYVLEYLQTTFVKQAA